ncbi:hypothetical protein CCR75_009429 [Bremia lactucae]|uniref:Uncharacterized protein n=1 Tax=Bremia lactucae TaxID=4779 RepID=A0A976ILG2_BRELC|nr:hypothetical protein CCR75_001120 [Bremia lactucae]TDH74027.1 hypothetical protein CCR75_009429 [Bremia lactucae]
MKALQLLLAIDFLEDHRLYEGSAEVMKVVWSRKATEGFVGDQLESQLGGVHYSNRKPTNQDYHCQG